MVLWSKQSSSLSAVNMQGTIIMLSVHCLLYSHVEIATQEHSLVNIQGTFKMLVGVLKSWSFEECRRAITFPLLVMIMCVLMQLCKDTLSMF